jgi:hypothetical protein
MTKPNTEPFTPDPAMVAALAAVKAVEDIVASVTAKLANETATLADHEEHRIELALPAATGGAKEMAAYDGAVAVADKTRDRIDFLQSALRGAEQRVLDAKEEMQKLGRATVIASQVRCNNARMKAATAVQEAIGSLGAAYNKLLDANERNLLCWPNVAVIPPSAFVAPKEVSDAIAVEFARVSSPADPLAGDARPPLPGSASTTFLGNPRELKSFVAGIEASNAWLLRLVETGK